MVRENPRSYSPVQGTADGQIRQEQGIFQIETPGEISAGRRTDAQITHLGDLGVNRV